MIEQHCNEMTIMTPPAKMPSTTIIRFVLPFLATGFADFACGPGKHAAIACDDFRLRLSKITAILAATCNLSTELEHPPRDCRCKRVHHAAQRSVPCEVQGARSATSPKFLSPGGRRGKAEPSFPSFNVLESCVCRYCTLPASRSNSSTIERIF